MQLVKPSIDYKKEYLIALEEGSEDTGITRLAKPGKNHTFEDFIKQLNDYSKGVNLLPDHVRSTTLWLIDNNEFIGRVSIRHELNNKLLKTGGHIGYYIRRSKRGKGYGKQILALGLIEAKRLGISKALITCDDDNIASIKIIEQNGGVLENIIIQEAGKPKLRRYWINN